MRNLLFVVLYFLVLVAFYFTISNADSELSKFLVYNLLLLFLITTNNIKLPVTKKKKQNNSDERESELLNIYLHGTRKRRLTLYPSIGLVIVSGFIMTLIPIEFNVIVMKVCLSIHLIVLTLAMIMSYREWAYNR